MSSPNLSPSMAVDEYFPMEAALGTPGGSASYKPTTPGVPPRKRGKGVAAANLLASAVAVGTAVAILTFGGSEEPKPPVTPPPVPTAVVSTTPMPTPTPTPEPTPTPTPAPTPTPTPRPAGNIPYTPPYTPPANPPAVSYTKPAPEPVTVSDFAPPTYGVVSGFTLSFPFTLNDATPQSVTITGTSSEAAYGGGQEAINVSYNVGDPNLVVSGGKATANIFLDDHYPEYNLTATLHYTMPDNASPQTADNSHRISPSFLTEMPVSGSNTIELISATNTLLTFRVTCSSLHRGILDFVLDYTSNQLIYNDTTIYDVPAADVSTPTISGHTITYTFTAPAVINGAPAMAVSMDADLRGHCNFGQPGWDITSISSAKGAFDNRTYSNINAATVTNAENTPGYNVTYRSDYYYESALTGVPEGRTVDGKITAAAAAAAPYRVQPTVTVNGSTVEVSPAVANVYVGEAQPEFTFAFTMPQTDVAAVVNMNAVPLPSYDMPNITAGTYPVTFNKTAAAEGQNVEAYIEYTKNPTTQMRVELQILHKGSIIANAAADVFEGNGSAGIYSGDFAIPPDFDPAQMSAVLIETPIRPVPAPTVTAAIAPQTAAAVLPDPVPEGQPVTVKYTYTNTTDKVLLVAMNIDGNGSTGSAPAESVGAGASKEFTASFTMPPGGLTTENFKITFTETYPDFTISSGAEGGTISVASAAKEGSSVTITGSYANSTAGSVTAYMELLLDGTVIHTSAPKDLAVGDTLTDSADFTMPGKDVAVSAKFYTTPITP